PTHIGALTPKLASEHLAHRAVELNPMQDVAVANVEDISAAALLAVARLYVLLELEALERAVARKRGGRPERAGARTKARGQSLGRTRPARSCRSSPRRGRDSRGRNRAPTAPWH